MKTLNLFALLSVILLSLTTLSCSKDDDVNSDKLLSSTVWTKSDRVPISSYDPGIIYQPSQLDQFLAYLYYNFPSITPDNITIDYIELNEEDSTLIELRDESMIKFSNEQCIYTISRISHIGLQQFKVKYKKAKIPSQEGKNRKGQTYKILPNGIYIIDESLYPEPVLFMRLDNSELKEMVSKTVLSEEKITRIDNNISINFSFTRIDNEILLKNDSLEWLGTLDKWGNYITIEQTRPEKKIIGEFKKN